MIAWTMVAEADLPLGDGTLDDFMGGLYRALRTHLAARGLTDWGLREVFGDHAIVGLWKKTPGGQEVWTERIDFSVADDGAISLGAGVRVAPRRTVSFDPVVEASPLPPRRPVRDSLICEPSSFALPCFEAGAFVPEKSRLPHHKHGARGRTYVDIPRLRNALAVIGGARSRLAAEGFADEAITAGRADLERHADAIRARDRLLAAEDARRPEEYGALLDSLSGCLCAVREGDRPERFFSLADLNDQITEHDRAAERLLRGK